MAGDFSFRPEFRLRQAQDFKATFAHRRVLRGTLFDLHYRPNGLETARLGLVIPKRHAKLAVTRNRLKRLAREVFRHRRADAVSADLVLRLAKPCSSDTSATHCRDDIEALLARLPK